MENLREINLNQLIAKNSSNVFVINTSKKPKAGMVFIAVTPDNDSTIGIIVPHTWVPINLGEQIAKEDLIKSARFRRAIGAKLIKLVDEEDALEFIESSVEAQAAVAKAQMEIIGIEKQNVANQEIIAKKPDNLINNTKLAAAMNKSNEIKQHDIIEANFNPGNVNLAIKEAIGREDISEIELYNVMRNIANSEGGFTDEEVEYINKHVKIEKVLAFVNNKVNK